MEEYMYKPRPTATLKGRPVEIHKISSDGTLVEVFEKDGSKTWCHISSIKNRKEPVYPDPDSPKQLFRARILNELQALAELAVHVAPILATSSAILNGEFDSDIESFDGIKASSAADLLITLQSLKT